MPLTRKQDDLRATIRGLLDRYPVDHDAGDGAEGRLWQRLCVEFGAGGLAIPERFGGGGTGPVEVHVVMEELGQPLTPSVWSFGRPIASFQALQHRMAETHVLVQSARSLSYAAAQAAEHGAPDTGLRAAAAKVYCSEALQQVSAEMIQLHGAIGMTWEHMAHRYFKRGHGAAMLLARPPATSPGSLPLSSTADSRPHRM